MDEIVVGSHVLVNSKHKAVVKYIGTTSFAEGVWYGLELERTIGKHEGTVLGTTYFTSPPRRGTFVRKENLSLYDPELAAANSIQSLGRMTLAKKKVKQEIAWRTFNTLDADDEAQHLQRQAKLLGTVLGAKLTRDRPPISRLDQYERDAMNSPPDEGPEYTSLEFPLTAEGILNMMDDFKVGKLLNYRDAMKLVTAFRRYSGALPTLVEIDIKENERLTVCGDTHGQLQDLFSIYTLNGVPSPTNRYLMNGDFVDRGNYGCEIFFTNIAWSLLYPGKPGSLEGAACLQNRGNHETHAQNVTGGFYSEVIGKYSGPVPGAVRSNLDDDESLDRGFRLYDAIQAAFDALPLATLVSRENKRIFVVHGGLLQRPGVTLAHIAAIHRKREIPYGLPGFEDKLFEDLMWSDPRPISSTVASDRGAGVFFGSDVTEQFCALNRVSLVVRSHECVPEGFLFAHQDRLVTVFSASRYCGRGTNKGAVLQFDSKLDLTIRQFAADSLEHTQATHAARRELSLAPAASKPVTHSLSSEGPAFELAQAESVRKMLMERIFLRKSDLFFFFSTADKAGSRDGCITRLVWADGMRTVLDLELPWLTLSPMLAEVEADGRINYSRFLDRYRIAMHESDMEWMENITENVCRRLFAATSSLEESFKTLDEDHSGTIEFDELERALLRMNLGLSRPQIYEIMRGIDSDCDGKIQFQEYSDRFRLVFSRLSDDTRATGKGAGAGATAANSTPRDPWAEKALADVATALFGGPYGSNAPSVFARIDSNGDGLLSEDEFALALRGVGLRFTDAEISRLVKHVDFNSSGMVNYLEFVTAFKVMDKGCAPLQKHILTWSDEKDGSKEKLQDPAREAQLRASLAAELASNHNLPALEKVKAAAAEAEARSLSNLVSSSGSKPTGTASTSAPAGSVDWKRAVIEKLVSVLYEYRVELGAAFSMFDTDRSGKISSKEFRVGLQALTSLSGSPLTDMQADEILRVLDTNGDGEIDWQEFVGAFKLVDIDAGNTFGSATLLGSPKHANSVKNSGSSMIMSPNIDLSARNF